MDPVISVQHVDKTYGGGFTALRDIELDIRKGEIFALLGPNGAGKTTLISIICGLVTPSSGRILAAGHDILDDYRNARKKIGLVPQELATDTFETVWATLRLSRGLFGYPEDDALLERVLRDLSLWNKRNAKIMTLSGGMKRRVMIAKALVHEPEILFLDEPTAGVDVELRRDMWNLVHQLRDSGVTIILTTHYIEEAEEMADRVGVINRGEIIVVDETRALMERMGRKQLNVHLQEPLETVPEELGDFQLELDDDGHQLVYDFDASAENTGIALLMRKLDQLGIAYKDLHSRQSSLEDIFVDLVKEKA